MVAEIIGGIVLIAISSLLIRLFYPRRWLDEAREKVKQEAPDEDDEFDPWQRMTSRGGWYRVGHQFVMEWKMVWQEILIGFTVAGFMKAFVSTEFWNALFLQGVDADFPAVLVTLENVLIAPFVAAATFIGSMGNIPLATILAGSGVGFAGLMAFIYSDLMVPPLVKVNAAYYGWKVALFIAGIMYVSIVATALLLDTGFGVLGMRPEAAAGDAMEQQFAIDYTFFFNIAFVLIAAGLILLHRRHRAASDGGAHDHDHDQGIDIQKYVAWLAIAVLATGMAVFAITT